jgi:hypothetical protein
MKTTETSWIVMKNTKGNFKVEKSRRLRCSTNTVMIFVHPHLLQILLNKNKISRDQQNIISKANTRTTERENKKASIIFSEEEDEASNEIVNLKKPNSKKIHQSSKNTRIMTLRSLNKR